MSCGVGLACANESVDVAGSNDSTDVATDSSDSGESAQSTSDDSSTDSSDPTTDTTDTTTTDTVADLPDPPFPPNESIPPPDAEGCPGLYAQDLLPTFELTVAPEVWATLVEEWATGASKEALELEYNPLHPLEQFQYNDVIINHAMIRLRGNPNHWDPLNKMQFHVDFNEIDKSGRFLGLRSLALDAAPANRNMLRDRLALSIMRDMGITAPCANHARVTINGEYYGIFTNIEKLNKNFLDRVFDDPTGDLWKRANWVLKTNETTANDARLKALKAANSVAELETYLDLEQALRVFAAEAILPNSDGMWAGGLNFYLYDDPLSGKFLMLPWDLDNTFDRFKDPPLGAYPINPDPIVWEKWTTHGRPFYDLALTDDDWFVYYILSIADQVTAGYDVDTLHDRIDTWTAQIEESVFEDENKPFSNAIYEAEVEILRDYVEGRAEFLDAWLDCWQSGGFSDAEGYCVAP